MQASAISTASYAKVIAKSKRVRWDIEADVLRGRRFDLSKPFLPSGLSLAGDEEIKPQELFRRLETLMAADIDGTHLMRPRFQNVLFPTMSPGPVERVNGALASLLTAAPAEPSRIVEPA